MSKKTENDKTDKKIPCNWCKGTGNVNNCWDNVKGVSAPFKPCGKCNGTGKASW